MRVASSVEDAPWIDAGERLLIMAPHPDDEALGAAGLAQRVLSRSGRVRTLLFTAGDGFSAGVTDYLGHAPKGPADYLDYGRERSREARRAAQILGADPLHVALLGYPDGGLRPLLAEHWADAHPERSEATHSRAVPYADAREPGRVYSGHSLRAQLSAELRAFSPTLIAFTDPLDQHADHSAVGVLALAAASEFARSRPAPKLLAYLVHWHAWPPDSGETSSESSAQPARSGRMLELPRDLPRRDQARRCLLLSDRELARKHAALAAYRTQQRVIGPFLSAFVRRSECFSWNTTRDAFAARALLPIE